MRFAIPALVMVGVPERVEGCADHQMEAVVVLTFAFTPAALLPPVAMLAMISSVVSSRELLSMAVSAPPGRRQDCSLFRCRVATGVAVADGCAFEEHGGFSVIDAQGRPCAEPVAAGPARGEEPFHPAAQIPSIGYARRRVFGVMGTFPSSIANRP